MQNLLAWRHSLLGGWTADPTHMQSSLQQVVGMETFSCCRRLEWGFHTPGIHDMCLTRRLIWMSCGRWR